MDDRIVISRSSEICTGGWPMAAREELNEFRSEVVRFIESELPDALKNVSTFAAHSMRTRGVRSRRSFSEGRQSALAQGAPEERLARTGVAG